MPWQSVWKAHVPRAHGELTDQMTPWPSAELGFKAACSRACVDHVVQVTPWPSSELGYRNHSLIPLGKPDVLEN